MSKIFVADDYRWLNVLFYLSRRALQTLELMWQMSPVENCISHSTSAFVYSFNPECFSLPRHLLICQRHHVQPLGLRPGLNGFGFAGNADVTIKISKKQTYQLSKLLRAKFADTDLSSMCFFTTTSILHDEQWWQWTIIKHMINTYVLGNSQRICWWHQHMNSFFGFASSACTAERCASSSALRVSCLKLWTNPLQADIACEYGNYIWAVIDVYGVVCRANSFDIM